MAVKPFFDGVHADLLFFTIREELIPNWCCCCCNTELKKLQHSAQKYATLHRKSTTLLGCVLDSAVHALECSLDQENPMFELGGAPMAEIRQGGPMAPKLGGSDCTP